MSDLPSEIPTNPVRDAWEQESRLNSVMGRDDRLERGRSQESSLRLGQIGCIAILGVNTALVGAVVLGGPKIKLAAAGLLAAEALIIKRDING